MASVVLFCFAVDDCQAVEEDGAVRLLAIGVLSVRCARCQPPACQHVDCVVVAAERVVDERFVVGQLERIGRQRLGLLEGLERVVIMSLAALNLGDMNLRLRILRLGRDDVVEHLERLVQLAVGEQSVGQAALGVEIVGVEIERAMVGGDRILVLLQLLVAGAQERTRCARNGRRPESH